MAKDYIKLTQNLRDMARRSKLLVRSRMVGLLPE